MTWTLGADAAATMYRDQREHPDRELAWACDRDDAAKVLTTARLIARGSATRVPVNSWAIRPTQAYIHSHIGRGLPTPSVPDLEVAETLCACNVLFGIISSDDLTLYLVTEPRLDP